MAARQSADPAKTRQAVLAVADWLRDENRPPRSEQSWPPRSG
ncbi:hypothetical protein I552_2625 [Mycobacterium xenopi 3993]|nr:hypothetical protein I552_2625 [Mycobacterium xenopi 3993]